MWFVLRFHLYYSQGALIRSLRFSLSYLIALNCNDRREMDAGCPTDGHIRHHVVISLLREIRLKTHTAFLHSDITDKLSLDMHVPVKTISTSWRQTY